MNNASQWQKEINGPKKPGKTWLNALLVTLALPILVSAQTEVSADTYLEPSDSREISFIETGIIDAINVNEGQYVRKGQALVVLNSDVVKAQYDVAKAKAEGTGRISAAKAEVDQQSQRYKQIYRLGNPPEIAREGAILQVKKGNLTAVQEDSKIFRLEALLILAELKKKSLNAPISGYVIDVTKDVGEPVGGGRNDPNKPDYLIRIVNISTLEATAFLPYKAVRHIKVGDNLTVTSSDIDEEWQTTGKVDYISPIIDPATGTKRIKVVINNSKNKFASGIPAKVVVQVPATLSANTSE